MPTKEYIKEYRDKRRQFAIEYLGGYCKNCGTTTALQFDHKVPEGKINEISSMLTTKMNLFVAELDKCQLLCYICHLKKTIENGDLTHNREGWKHNVSGYINQKCRCEICKEAYHQYRVKRWAKDKI